jgi:hypothetical protein
MIVCGGFAAETATYCPSRARLSHFPQPTATRWQPDRLNPSPSDTGSAPSSRGMHVREAFESDREAVAFAMRANPWRDALACREAQKRGEMSPCNGARTLEPWFCASRSTGARKRQLRPAAQSLRATGRGRSPKAVAALPLQSCCRGGLRAPHVDQRSTLQFSSLWIGSGSLRTESHRGQAGERPSCHPHGEVLLDQRDAVIDALACFARPATVWPGPSNH